jgi:hypothetical protein
MGKVMDKGKRKSIYARVSGLFTIKSTNRWNKYYTAADYTDITTQLYSEYGITDK